MKGMRCLAILALLIGLFCWMSTGAFAVSISVDGDVTDWGIDLNYAVDQGYLDNHLPSSPSADVETEDNDAINSDKWVQVYPGWSYNNDYDAEAIYFDNDSLYGYVAIITGVSPSSTWPAGDIGFDVDMSEYATLYDQDGTGSAGDTPYEYGIKLSNKQLYKVSSWYSAHYDGDPSPDYAKDSDPWAIMDGTSLGGVDLVYSSCPNGHYVIETKFLLSDLGLNPGDEFNIHWTMKCGNDFLTLKAKVDPVPEPGTILLVGTGLLGLALGSRKRKTK